MSQNLRTVKCLAVGDDGVGKTCMLLSYANGSFPEYTSTLNYSSCTNVTVDNTQVMLQLLETAGGEGYDRLRPLAYPGTDVFLVCFNIILPSSFESISRKWIPEIRHHCPDAPIILVGAVSDLRDTENTLRKLAADGSSPITYEQGVKIASEINAHMYLECSSLTQEGLKKIFDEAVRSVIEQGPRQKKKVCILL